MRITSRMVWSGAWLAGTALLGALPVHAAGLNFHNAVVVTPGNLTKAEHKAVQMLVDEVHKRTLVRWQVVHAWPGEAVPVVAVGPGASVNVFAGPFAGAFTGAAAHPNGQRGQAAEGYRIAVRKTEHGAAAVLVIGNDPRGVLFGVGGLLRLLHMTRHHVTLDDGIDVASAPAYPLRGHQLGYRPKTNSYDGWSLPIWEQYIRDLAVFGSNAVELIPPRSDDAADSPHFPLPPMEMMVGMSQLLDDYGLDVWIWYPALDRDYANPSTVEFALKEWGEVFKRLPRIDAVFVPGGDPGHTQPKHLMALLARQTESLHRYHPKAQMWVSPQGFTQAWLDEFYGILREEQPKWLSGIVYGPQVRVSLPQLRAAVSKEYPIRRYPDITHSRQCQYPVPDWDLAYALTEARECINPRPSSEAAIFRAFAKEAIGFLTYSEGCNDDVNKMLWSALGWNPDSAVIDILRDYSRYFIGEPYADSFAQGLLALERNWQGPLLTNESVYTTLKQFRDMEKNASPQDRLNWRFQQALYRAYYDAYERSRLIYETGLEDQAMSKLRMAKQVSALIAMRQAEAILGRADTERVSTDWRARVFELAEALFQSIRMQLSVERYQAIDVGRGANLDTIDVPLNNRLWLVEQFKRIRKSEDEGERLRGIEAIVHWDDPGPGGFYDDLGNPARQPHLVRGNHATDPAFLRSSLVGFTYFPGWRMSWCNHAESLNDAPLKMRYTNLDRTAAYKIRVVYAGDSLRTRLRLVANDDVEVHPYVTKQRPVRPVEFDIPRNATATGTLELSWYRDLGLGGNGRGCQVAEVWLIKN
jgi:hypothetical protein